MLADLYACSLSTIISVRSWIIYERAGYVMWLKQWYVWIPYLFFPFLYPETNRELSKRIVHVSNNRGDRWGSLPSK
jgi:hypothetical protein